MQKMLQQISKMATILVITKLMEVINQFKQFHINQPIKNLYELYLS